MVSACILICCKAGKFPDVAGKIKNFDGVVRAFSVCGRWDVVVEVEASDMKALAAVALKVNGLDGVRATETLIEVIP